MAGADRDNPVGPDAIGMRRKSSARTGGNDKDFFESYREQQSLHSFVEKLRRFEMEDQLSCGLTAG